MSDVAETLEVPAPVLDILRTLEAAGHESWCVGGALRDALLGIRQTDFDVATSAAPDQIRSLFRRTVPVGERFGTIGVLDRAGRLHEVTTFRRDVSTDGRHAVVEFGASLDEDLARRDFTINALAYHPERGWRDPSGGRDDLGRRVIRAVGVPAERFREDYLRILRALRFAARLDFDIEPATWRAMRDAAGGLRGLSAERVRMEWIKGIESARSLARLAELWRESGAAEIWVPELRSLDQEIDARASAAARDPVLLTVILCAHPADVFQRLRGSNAEVSRAAAIAAAPAAPSGPGSADVRRWLALVGERADDILRLHELLHGAPAPWTSQVAAIRERGEPVDRSGLAIRGNDLVAVGLSGPAVGRALDHLLNRVLDDPSLNTRESLLAIARTIA